jgi:Uma2 family endonuclease
MGDAAAIRHMSAEEYLAWEREQPEKHEYHLGEVFAMAGGSPRHNFLCGRMISRLEAALEDKGCIVLTSDQKISAKSGERYVYPDVVAVCGGFRAEPGTTGVLTNPTVIVEVLSPSTEAYDRGEKWEAYQRLPSLTDYLLVAQTTARVGHYQRAGGGSWTYRLVEAGGTVTLANGAMLSVDAVYKGAFELEAS